MSLAVTGQPGSQQAWVKPLQLSPGDGDGGAEPCRCSQNGNTTCRPEASLGHASVTWAAASPASWLGLSGHGEHRQGQKWGWGGVGQEAPVPTASADLPLPQHSREDQQGPAPSVSTGTLPVWALSLTSSGCQCVEVSQKAILVPCWKACVLSSASLHRYKQGQAVWFTGKSTLEGLRGPGPATLCCLILDKLTALSLFSIFHQQELTMDGLSQL